MNQQETYWIEEYDYGYEYKCSNCDKYALTKAETAHDYVCTPYCPWCGKKMNGIKEESENIECTKSI